MQELDQKHKIDFSVKGVYLGLIAYLVLICILAIIFIFG